MARSAVVKKRIEIKQDFRDVDPDRVVAAFSATNEGRGPEPAAFKTPPTVFVPFEQINPANYNPRTITPRQLEALKEGIRAYGLVEPLVLQKRGMTIIGGHQRYRAVREVCIEAGLEVPLLPCIVLDVGDREAKRLNIALNRVSGDWDERLLGELLSDIHTHAPIVAEDVLILGFEEPAEIGSLIGGDVGISMGYEPKGTGPLSTTRTPSLSLDFASKEERDAVKALIASKAPKKGKEEPSGSTLARMLGVKGKKSQAS